MTLLSIIVVTKDRQNYLLNCIDNLNRLVKDCGSNIVRYVILDGSSNPVLPMNFIGSFGKYVSKTDTGIYNAMNTAFLHSESKYIMFIGDDDIVNTASMCCALKSIANSIREFDAYIFPVIINGSSLSRLWVIDLDMKRWSMPFPHSGLLISSSFHKHINGFDEKYRVSSDYDYALRFLSSNPTIHIDNSIGPIVTFALGGASSHIRSIHENLQIRISNHVHPFNIFRGFLYDSYRYYFNTRSSHSRNL